MNIILSPHFDDAVLSLGGLLAHEASDTVVATFFAGAPLVPRSGAEARWDMICGFKDSTEAIDERSKEDKRALNFMGVPGDQIHTYEHLDRQYRFANKKLARETSEPELEALVRQEILDLLRKYGTADLKMFAPGLELSTDHGIVKRAAVAAAHSSGRNRSFSIFLYQDLPHSAHILEEKYSRTIWRLFVRQDRATWNYGLLKDMIADASLSISPVVTPLTAADMKKKLEGIGYYKSQVDHLGKDLLKTVKHFSSGQAQSLSISAPYCEVVYELS